MNAGKVLACWHKWVKASQVGNRIYCVCNKCGTPRPRPLIKRNG